MVSIVGSIITVIAIAINAVVALQLGKHTLFFHKKQIEHNMNSIRPICDIRLTDYEDKISVSLFNAGVGPLEIKEFSCEGPYGSSPILANLIPEMKQPWHNVHGNPSGMTLAVGEAITLIEINPQDDCTREKIRNTLKDIAVYVRYADICNTGFEKHKKLAFFGRPQRERVNCISGI